MSVESRTHQRRHELLTDLQAQSAREMVEYGIPTEVADLVASALVDHLAGHWGGQVISFPKDSAWKLTARELEIYDQHTGNNKPELARKYNMSVRGMRKLIARIDAKIKAARPPAQLDMLDPAVIHSPRDPLPTA